MAGLGIVLVFLTALLTLSIAQDGEVILDVHDKPTGELSPTLFGMNLFQGFKPKIAGKNGSEAYKTHVAAMGSRFYRYHDEDMQRESNTSSSGWIIGENSLTPSWNASKIAAAMTDPLWRNLSHPQLMFGFNYVPLAWRLNATSHELNPKHLDDLAQLSLSLLDILSELHVPVTHFEIWNEPDGHSDVNMTSIGMYTAIIAKAIKHKYPKVLVGGPAFARPDLHDNVRAYLGPCADTLDFLSFHSYATGSMGANTSIYRSADTTGTYASDLPGIVAEFTSKVLLMIHDEFNISWNPPDSRMTNAAGAVFDALALISLAQAQADGAAAWNEGDGWYGKLNNDAAWTPRPSAHLFQLLNTHMQGDLLPCAVSPYDFPTVACLASVGHANVTLMVVNRADEDIHVKIIIDNLALPSKLKLASVSDAGRTTRVVNSDELANLPMARNEIVFFTHAKPSYQTLIFN